MAYVSEKPKFAEERYITVKTKFLDPACSRNAYYDNIRIRIMDIPEVLQQNHYYPFGMNLYGLEESDAQSTVPLKENMYQYNGKERETSLDLHWYDYGARQYDVQLGRFHVTDRFSEKYFPLTTYQYTANNPVNFIDVNGDSIWVKSGGQRYYWGESEGTYGFLDKNGNHANLDDKHVKNTAKALHKLMGGGDAGNTLVTDLAERKENVLIIGGSKDAERGRKDIREFDGKGNAKIVESYDSHVQFTGISDMPGLEVEGMAFISLGHELAHSQDRINGTIDETNIWIDAGQTKGLEKNISNAEKYATHIENKIRAENNLPLRRGYMLNSKGKVTNGKIIDSEGRSLFFGRDGLPRKNYKKIKDEEQRYIYKE